MQSFEADSQERWVHDLRNVVNVLGSGVTLSRRLIEKGRHEEARDVLQESEKALARCFALLSQCHSEERGDSMQRATLSNRVRASSGTTEPGAAAGQPMI